MTPLYSLFVSNLVPALFVGLFIIGVVLMATAIIMFCSRRLHGDDDVFRIVPSDSAADDVDTARQYETV